MHHRVVSAAGFISAGIFLVACTSIQRDRVGSGLHPSPIWSFTSASEITNAFRGRDVSIDHVRADTDEFLVVSEQYRSTAIVDSMVYQRFAPDFWHCRGFVSSYSERDIGVQVVLSGGVLSLYRDQQLQAQFKSTAQQEMRERQRVQ